MIISSFNINGIRSHIDQVKKLINLYNPFLIALQETKTNNDKFPKDIFIKNNYFLYTNGYNNYNGVAIASKIKANNFYKKFTNSKINFENRISICDFIINNNKLIVINVYIPHGKNKFNISFKYKILFIKELIFFIKYLFNIFNNNKIYILLLGDINISPYKIDIGLNIDDIHIWKKYNICSFLNEETIMFENIINCGLIDIIRYINKNDKKFTWFGYKNKNFIKNEGLRLDMFLCNKEFIKICKNSFMEYSFFNYFDKKSDHIPIILNLNL